MLQDLIIAKKSMAALWLSFSTLLGYFDIKEVTPLLIKMFYITKSIYIGLISVLFIGDIIILFLLFIRQMKSLPPLHFKLHMGESMTDDIYNT